MACQATPTPLSAAERRLSTPQIREPGLAVRVPELGPQRVPVAPKRRIMWGHNSKDYAETSRVKSMSSSLEPNRLSPGRLTYLAPGTPRARSSLTTQKKFAKPGGARSKSCLSIENCCLNRRYQGFITGRHYRTNCWNRWKNESGWYAAEHR